MNLSPAQKNRAAGVLVGVAVGDALGIPYEFKEPQGLGLSDLIPGMPGGGPFGYAPGEFSDDTQMTLCITRAALRHDLEDYAGLHECAAEFSAWYRSGPKDVGGQVSSVLREFHPDDTNLPNRMLARSREVHEKNPTNTAGNGSLMRTAPIALRYLGNAMKTHMAAGLVSSLTHADPSCLDACAIWSRGIGSAVLNGAAETGVRAGAADTEDPMLWHARLTRAEEKRPEDFAQNGWVIHAMQAAWSAYQIGVRADSFAQGIRAAVNCGLDTDTVAAIAGGMLGAYFGLSGIPVVWRNGIRGGDGTTAEALADFGIGLALQA